MQPNDNQNSPKDKTKATKKQENKTTIGKPFEKGNEFYKLRTNFKPLQLTPEEIINKSAEYFETVKANPIQEPILHQRSGEVITIKKPRPYNIYTLCTYIGITRQTWHKYKTLEQNLKHGASEEERQKARAYTDICAYIEDICHAQKLELALIGLYNPIITSRLLGLKDRQEIEETSNRTLNIEVIQSRNTDNVYTIPSQDNEEPQQPEESAE